MKILIVSDDSNSAELLTVIFRQAGLMAVATHRTSSEGALSAYAREAPDMVLIDDNGADFDSLEICKALRLEAAAPIILSSPRTEEEYILQAFGLGIDEYVAKPFSPRILAAKVKALLRRARSLPLSSVSSLEAGGVELNPERRTVRLPSQPEISLTNLEFRLLYCLMSNQGRVVPTETIVERVWGYSGEADYRLVKGLVRRLRRKVEPDTREPHYIRTIPGVGYAFSPTEEQAPL
ncbi:MAG TPA: response regulator transcription factor [Anaerolineae bacterium]|nr:response regulator transcription factor [Anaerolineae bacterium]